MDRSNRCQMILQKCLAIRLRKNGGLQDRGHQTEVQDYWMYDNGYLLFQALLEANCKCFWNPSILEAMQQLQFEGYVAQSTLLVRGNACALEVVRNAWARNVLKPPNNYSIVFVGDIDDCLVTLVNQGQFTPLPEALCWVILELTSSGQHAVMESVRSCLHVSFPGIERPSSQLVYDTLAKLMQDKKIYQTSQGYFIVTPESRRLRPQRPGGASPATRRAHRRSLTDPKEDSRGSKSLLMTTEEALTYVHGEMTTIRDGDVTHQSIQTNLYDVICGGNPNDKILYPTPGKRSIGLERRNSLKLFGSSKKLNSGLVRSGSMKYISHKHANLTDSSSSTDTSSQIYQPISTKKTSFLARIFRRSGRKRGMSAPPSIQTFSAQFPPSEWFNPKVIHMHCVGTQTKPQEVLPLPVTENENSVSCRSYSLPRRSKSPFLKTEKNSPRHTPSPRRLQPELPDRTSRSRRSSVSKSSKSLNENRIYEEIRNQSSADIYSKITEKNLSSTPTTPKYSRRLEKRSSSLPRRKSSRLEPVTCTDFPYDKLKDETPIMPNLTSRRSSSFENLVPTKVEDKLHQDGPHDMTSLTSSGYDTQTNSIISTSEVPYSLKVSNSYLTSSTPPPSLTIIEDTSAFTQVVSLTSNVSVNGDITKGSVSVEVSTPEPNIGSRQRLERFPSLYSPREVLKTGYGFEHIDYTPAQSEDDLDKLSDMFPTKVQVQSSKMPVKKSYSRAGDKGMLITTSLGKDIHFQDFPSLSDLTVNFKSLAAQNILHNVNNVSVTSVDTLVEVNMAASREDKSLVNVSTDFSVV